ncbi:MAG: hypothetical protein EP343_29035 [Deltaproteobacteria bacterium]|nr:MAG: hypothetical protein EP343_29035 [Deltaproteobacteria bacterium]
MSIQGQCHCRNISYQLEWPHNLDVIPCRACSCSFCTVHGASYTSHPKASLSVGIRVAEEHSIYRFGTETADFHVCSRCGCVPFVTCEIDGQVYAVVNTKTFGSIENYPLEESTADFGNEDVSVRLARRKKFWIPNVSIDIPTQPSAPPRTVE